MGYINYANVVMEEQVFRRRLKRGYNRSVSSSIPPPRKESLWPMLVFRLPLFAFS